MVYPVLLIVLFLGLLAGFAYYIRRLGRRDPERKQPDCIKTGNISIFFDREGNITIVLYAKDKLGIGKAVGKPVSLKIPYTPEKLGKTIRQAMLMCADAEPCSDAELMSLLRAKEWKEFSEGKRNMSVFYAPGYGIVMNTTRRGYDGSYQFNVAGYEKVLQEDTEDVLIGNTVIGLLSRCRS